MQLFLRKPGPVLFALLWTLAVLFTYTAAYVLEVMPQGIDDAYIFFVYAENFAAGDGFVYNAGGERVEGFTSLLWVLLLAGLKWLGLKPVTAGFLLSSLLLAGIVWATQATLLQGLVANHLGRRTKVVLSMAACAWFIASPAWLLWQGATLMDLVLWSFLITLFVMCYTDQVWSGRQHPGVNSILLGLMALTRPEAMLWVPFFIVCLLLLARRQQEPLIRTLLLPVGVSLAAFGGLATFRYAYFGYPLPNTYYAKVSTDSAYNFSEGLAYLSEYLMGGGFSAPLIILTLGLTIFYLPRYLRVLGGVASGLDQAQFVQGFLAASVVTSLSVVLLVGGDHFGGARLLQPIYPLVFLFGAGIWAGWRKGRDAETDDGITPTSALLIFLGCLVLFAAPLRSSWYNIERADLRKEFRVAESGLYTAASLASFLQAGGDGEMPVAGVTGAGGFKYGWPGDVFDLLGLNDVAMAHSDGQRYGLKGHAGFNAGEFYRRPPELLLPRIDDWPGMEGCEQLQQSDAFALQVLGDIAAEARFMELYEYVAVALPAGRICMYVRRDYLGSLQLTDTVR